MSEILFQYQKVNPTTWVYLSSLLMIGLYFKFSRFWSVRNLDLVLLILLAPGLLTAQFGSEVRMRAMRLAEREEIPTRPDAVERSAEEIESLLRPRDSGPPWASQKVPDVPAGMIMEEALALADDLDERTAPDGGQVANDTEGEAALPREGLATVDEALQAGAQIERLGFLWLFAVGAAWLVRLLLDPTMVRRPLLEPNLTTGGLLFIGVSLFIFLMANVWASQRFRDGATRDSMALRQPAAAASAKPPEAASDSLRPGPGYVLLNLIPNIPTMPLVAEGVPETPQQRAYAIVAKIIAILCHLAVVLGIMAIGYWHFGNTKTGVGVATLYLMLPYTAQMTGHIDHVIPAALLVWAVLCYRRPLTSGMLIGLATSLVYYPLFLLPLWVSFYWRRGLMRFAIGVVVLLVLMAFSLVFIPYASYWENLQQMFGLWSPRREGLQGIWGLGWEPLYRIPVLAAFLGGRCRDARWPPPKNLGTLLSCTAAIMVATQFWHGYGGGLYIGWYLPLMLLTVFRPNLEDRVALAVLGEGWPRWRPPGVVNGFKAA